jgi:hypothetical protein
MVEGLQCVAEKWFFLKKARIAVFVPCTKRAARWCGGCGYGSKFVGDRSGGGTPGLISNPAVKPASADGTCTATYWERRSLPTFLFSFPHPPLQRAVCVFGPKIYKKHTPNGTGKPAPFFVECPLHKVGVQGRARPCWGAGQRPAN